jgi:F-box protein 21
MNYLFTCNMIVPDTPDTPDTYQDMRNHFIHKVLSSHRKSLPLSLVVVFVAICRRLGIPASPAGLPGHVHAFIPLHEGLSYRSVWASYYDAVEQGIHIDVYNFPTQPLIDVAPLLRRGDRDQLKPSSTHDMVFRAGQSILTSARLLQIELHSWELDSSVYAAFCIFLLPHQVGIAPARGFIQQIMAIVSQHYPMDLTPILQRLIAPALGGTARHLLEKYCAGMLEDEESSAVVSDRRSVRYFTGLVFVHRIFEFSALSFPLYCSH